MKKIIFTLKQLLPFTYISKFTTDGKKYLTVWKQWLFKPYKVETYRIG